MFRRSRHNTKSIFIFNQEDYDLSKRIVRDNGKINHICKPNNSRVFQNLSQDKKSTYKTLNEFEVLAPAGWNEKDQPFTTDMTKGQFTGRYGYGLITSLFVSQSSLFQIS